MAITVTMYKNFSKKANSTKIPTGTDAHSDFLCNIKDNASVLDPVLEVYLTGTDPADTPIGSGFNYCYIAKWSRYYFITDWKYNRGLWYAYCHVDVLASYKTSIGALSKYVLRSAANYDTNITDTFYPAKSNVTQTIKAGTVPFNLTNGCYILGLIGERPSGNVPNMGGINYYLLTESQMQEFSNYLTSSVFAQLTTDLTAGLTEAVSKAIINPIEYISSCMFFPFSITGVSETVQPKIGWWNTSPLSSGCSAIGSGIGGSSLLKNVTISSIAIGHHPEYTRGQYLDREPYSRYEFYLEPWGSIPLDGNTIDVASNLDIQMTVDLVSGFARLSFTNASKTILNTLAAQVGVPIQISQIMTDVIKGTTTMMGGIWSTIRSAISGDAISTIANAVTGITNTAEAYAPKPSGSGINGALLSYGGTQFASGLGNAYSQGPYLKIYRMSLTDENLAEFGRPLCMVKTLNTLSGYIQCAEPDCDIAALDPEKTAIGNYLTGGFYYE